MGRKKQKKEQIIITKESLLYQPLSLAVSGYEATAMQQNIIIAILRKLKMIFKANKDNQFAEEPKQLSFFSDEKVVAKYARKGELRFDIHMSELGVQPKHYPTAFDLLYKMSDAIVYVPDNESGTAKMRRTKLFDTADENVTAEEVNGEIIYKYKNRSPVTTVIMSESVVNFLFSPNSRIYDFLDDTAMMIAEKFPKRIYLYLSTKKSLPKFKIDYWKFRHDIGINDKDVPINPQTKEKQIIYPYYSDFTRRILNPAMDILKEMCDNNLCDFYFDVATVYKGSKRAKNPDELEFTFHFSDLGNSIKSNNGIIRENIEIEKLLTEKLMQTRIQANILLKKVTIENRMLFIDKVKKLISAKTNNQKIQDVRSWANKSLTVFLEELKERSVDLQKKMDFDFSDKKKEEEEAKKKEVPNLSDEDKKKWSVFLDSVKEKISENEFKTWFEPILFSSYKDDTVTLSVPSKFFYEFLDEKYLDVIKESLFLSFGEGIKLMYRVG